MAKSEVEKELDKMTKFKVSVTKNELLNTDLKSKYNKIQMFLSRLIGVKVADNFNYCYRVQYKSSVGRLNVKDVIMNNERRSFFVLKELNGIAVIVTSGPSIEKPFVHGTFRVIDKKKV